MSDWIKKARQNPPENLVLVLVKGFDCTGEWTQKAMRKDYAKPPKGTPKKVVKKGFRRGFRWVDEQGENIDDQFVCEWKHLT